MAGGDVLGIQQRRESCRVMEGGREALERGYRRLGLEPTHVR